MYDRACADIQEYSETIKRLEAERDAALAAVERCRGVLASWKSVQASNREHFESGNPGMFVPIDCVGGLSAALDGAPEPEWEWGSAHRDDLSQGATEYSEARARERVRDWNETTRSRNGVLVRRRKAGPWLLAEGESK